MNTIENLSRVTGLSVRSVRRWIARLGVRPVRLVGRGPVAVYASGTGDRIRRAVAAAYHARNQKVRAVIARRTAAARAAGEVITVREARRMAGKGRP